MLPERNWVRSSWNCTGEDGCNLARPVIGVLWLFYRMWGDLSAVYRFFLVFRTGKMNPVVPAPIKTPKTRNIQAGDVVVLAGDGVAVFVRAATTCDG